MNEDLPLEIIRYSDESRVQRDGSIENMRRVDFYLGKRGPFFERFPRDTYTVAQLNEHVEKLRTELRAIQT